MYGSGEQASARSYTGISGNVKSERGPLLSDADSQVSTSINRIEGATTQARTIADGLFGAVPRAVGGSEKAPTPPMSRGDSLRRSLTILDERISELQNELARFEAI